jgi:hypothetical protein
MTAKNQLGLAAASLLLWGLFMPSPAQAQRGAATARSVPVRARTAPAGRALSRTGGNRNSSTTANGMYFDASANGFVSAGGSFVPLQDILNTVPGLGFDYSHLAVLNADLGVKAFIDPVTEWRLATAERLLRGRSRFSGGGSGFYLLDGGGYSVPDEAAQNDQPAPQPQPQIIVLQQGSATQQTDQAGSGPEAESPPLADVGQFTLVLQSGKQIEAVAFTRTSDRIVYITADGNRRTIAASDLNSEATVRVNQERGTPLELPL